MSVASTIAIGCGATLGWTWVGYPLAIRMLAALVPGAPRAPVTSASAVSVVVATRDEPAIVADRIANLLESDHPSHHLEIVVAIDAATPRERRAALHALAADRVHVVDGDAPGGKAATLNAGVRMATGEVLVFTDAQQRFARDAITRLVTVIAADPRRPIVGGALQLPGDAPGATRSPVEWYWAAERRLRADEARLHSTIGVSGSIYAMRRDAWQPLPAHLILDDVFVPMRAALGGARVGYVLDAHAWDVRRTDADQERGRKVRTLTGNFQLVALLPGLLVPWRNPVWPQFVCHKLLRLLTPWLVLGTIVAGAVAVLELLPPAWLPPVLGGAALVAAIVFLLPPLGARGRALLRWGWSLQLAVVQATVNGVRGRWDVWR